MTSLESLYEASLVKCAPFAHRDLTNDIEQQDFCVNNPNTNELITKARSLTALMRVLMEKGMECPRNPDGLNDGEYLTVLRREIRKRKAAEFVQFKQEVYAEHVRLGAQEVIDEQAAQIIARAHEQATQIIARAHEQAAQIIARANPPQLSPSSSTSANSVPVNEPVPIHAPVSPSRYTSSGRRCKMPDRFHP
jgi:hypothetical protein